MVATLFKSWSLILLAAIDWKGPCEKEFKPYDILGISLQQYSLLTSKLSDQPWSGAEEIKACKQSP